MPLDYSYIATPQVPNAMNSLGSMLDIAGKAQQLQTSRQEFQRGGVELQKAQALLQPAIAQGQAASEIAQTGALAAKFRLQGEQAGVALNEAATLASDPVMQKDDPEGQIMALKDARQRMIARGVPEWQAEFQTAHLVPFAQKPGALYQMLQNIGRANAGPAAQAAVINAPVTPVTTPGGAIAPLQLQPGAPGAVQPVPISSLQPPAAAPAPAAPGIIPAGIPPGQVQQSTTDLLGNPIIVEKNQQGGISFKAPPGSAYKPVMALPPGESAQSVPDLLAMRARANALGAAAPAQHFNNKMILDLAPDAFTGTGGGKLASVLNSVGIQTTNDVGADTAALKHFIALQIEQNAASQGANTDAARSLAAQAVLPSDSPEKAIKSITKVNDAYVTGNQHYNAGLEAAIGNPNNQYGPLIARKFQNAWAANFDPRIAMLENAQKSGDAATIDRVLGPKGSTQRKATEAALLPKARALSALSQGQL
jgi:hypothetical protein